MALKSIISVGWVLYRLFQCRFFIACVEHGETAMAYAGTYPFLESLVMLHSCLLPNSDPLHVSSAARQREGNPADYTCPATGKPSCWPGKMQQISNQVEGQSKQHIVAGFGGTLAGQSQDVKIFASSPEIKAALISSPTWGAIHQDLCGLTAQDPEFARIRGMVPPICSTMMRGFAGLVR